MPFAFFKIRVNGEEAEMNRLNGFLASHRILAVRNEWVAAGEDSFWAFCVDYLETGGGQKPGRDSGGGKRIDYKEVLPLEQFAVFARLRDARKAVAESEGIPVWKRRLMVSPSVSSWWWQYFRSWDATRFSKRAAGSSHSDQSHT